MHDLPTTHGSLGASLIFSSVDNKDFTIGFLHYRRHNAAGFQAILKHLGIELYRSAASQ